MEVAVNVTEKEWRKKTESTIKMLKMTDGGRKWKPEDKSQLNESWSYLDKRKIKDPLCMSGIIREEKESNRQICSKFQDLSW